jgi:hypothetical protein
MFKNIFTFFSKNNAEDESLLCETESFRSSDSVSQSSSCISEINRIVRNTTDYDDPPYTETDRIVLELVNMYAKHHNIRGTKTEVMTIPDIAEKLIRMYKAYKAYNMSKISNDYQSFVELYTEMTALSRTELVSLIRVYFPDCTFTDEQLYEQHTKLMISVSVYYRGNGRVYDTLIKFRSDTDKHFEECKIYLNENNEALGKELLKPIPPFSNTEYIHLRTLYGVGETKNLVFSNANDAEIIRLRKIVDLSAKHPIYVDIHKKRLDELLALKLEQDTIANYIYDTLQNKSVKYKNVIRIKKLESHIVLNTRSDERIRKMWHNWFYCRYITN